MIRRLTLGALLAIALLASPAAAQIDDGLVRPDNIERLETSRPILEYALAFVFAVAALSLGFKSSKRVDNS